jgi:hypothetical protein
LLAIRFSCSRYPNPSSRSSPLFADLPPPPSHRPDVGSARADFAGGSAQDLFTSARTLLSLPNHYRIFSGHDYPGEDRTKSCFSSVADQRARNKHVNSRIVAEEFARMREERDATLGTPRLMHASLQVNLRGGRLPEADGNGRRWLRMPISVEEGLDGGF